MSKFDPAGAPLSDQQQRIVQASIQLIEEAGVGALSMREVARRAGVSHQAPYHHFDDREAILGAIAQEGFRMISDAIERAMAEQAPSLRARVTTALKTYVEFALQNPAHFRVMFRPELVNLQNCPGAQAEGDRAFSILQRLIDETVARGVPAHPSRDALLLLFWSVAHGFACLALDGPLTHKTPEAERHQQLSEVTEAFGAMVEATVKP
ncbi:MAG: TetR/AcrR family transcriptional regulator [Myxococcales bacterium]